MSRNLALTPVEMELMTRLANGQTIREAAEALGLQPQSAKNRLVMAYTKLGSRNRVEAFVALGWLTPPPVPA